MGAQKSAFEQCKDNPTECTITYLQYPAGMWRSSVSSRQKDGFPAWKRGRDGGRGVAARGCKKITFWTRSNQRVSLLGCFEEARYTAGTGKAASQAGRPDSGVCRATFHPGSTTPGFSWRAATSFPRTPCSSQGFSVDHLCVSSLSL